MKIAILMSTYNGHNYLDEQLKSIAEQTIINDIRLYIRDDGSSDDTFEIIEKWRNKINIILYKGSNIGPAKSFWELFMNSDIKADYYAFCDQDDVWDTDKVEKGVIKLSKCFGKPMLWCSNCRIINEKGDIVSPSMNTEVPQFNIAAQFVCGTTQGCAMMFNDELRKLVLIKSFSGNPMHDFVIMTNSIIYGSVIYDHTPSFSYRVHRDNVVEKNGKSFFSRILNTLNRWFSKNHKSEMSKYADELLKKDNDSVMLGDKVFLCNIIKSKSSIKSRFWLLSNSINKTSNKGAIRSFRIRGLLGIL